MKTECLIEIARKELKMFFASPIGYLFLAAYLGVTLFVFFWGEAFFARNIADVRPMFEWLPVLLIFLSSALTMRIWSDERRTGTIEFLSTLPATSWELVFGKFLACMVLLAIALVLTLPLPISVSIISNLDWGPVWAAYAAALLLGASYLSIGLFVSARSENQIVALIVAVAVCTAFYIVGSDFVTGLVNNDTAAFLREAGSGSRFESISRGILDFSDLYFYGSVTAVFLVLNVFVVKSLGWSPDGDVARHRNSMIISGLVIANLLVANFWINSLSFLRLDVTQGQQYSISSVTVQQLTQLQEPLLIRGYFSSKTHPLLAPLVPQIRDLVKEYGVVGGNRVRVEFVDPAEEPEMEDEANTKYGIRPVPFQVADRYQTSLVNSYFDILIRYGDEFEVLGFRDLIELKSTNESELLVRLRNPEYDITSAIKKVLSGFQGGGSVFDFIASEVSFTGYISSANFLPEQLEDLREPLVSALTDLKESSEGKFSWTILEPEADGGAVAQEIAENFGFQPMAASLFDTNRFYFYLTLTDGQIVVSMGIPDSRDSEGFTRMFEEGLKRFATGLLTSVALYTPTPPQQQYMGQQQMGTAFAELQGYLTNDYDVETTTLNEPIPNYVDVLVVVAPSSLREEQVFEIDQFLMKGGNVIVAAGGFQTMLMSQSLTASPHTTGLEAWLSHHGVTIDQTMVLDPRNSAFPVPVIREVGGMTFQEIQVLDYPFFVDVRNEGFVDTGPAVQDLDRLTFAWSSPILVDEERSSSLEVVELLRSSENSWIDAAPDVMPRITDTGLSAYTPLDPQESKLLAVTLKGKFTSSFSESPALVEARELDAELNALENLDVVDDLSEERLLDNGEASDSAEELESVDTTSSDPSSSTEEGEREDDSAGETETPSQEDSNGASDDQSQSDTPESESEEAALDALEQSLLAEEEEESEPEDTLGVVGSVIGRSPESARLVVIGSSEFLSDQSVRMISSAQGSLYVNSYQFISNLIDVSMEDSSLLSIRSRGHFNRTLPTLSQTHTNLIEYGNYLAGVAGLAIVFGVNWLLRRRRHAEHASWFGAH